MRRWILIGLLLLVPWVACANPIEVDTAGLSKDWILVFAALAAESAVVVAVLAFVGVNVFRFFVLYFAANSAVFVLVFLPLMRFEQTPAVAESIIVAVDGLAIKLLGNIAALQGPNFRALNWWLALTASVLGNAASFFIGWLMLPVD